MNILMLTNTYLPHVGGVARSVDQFASHFRACGHRVLIVAPHYEGADDDPHVVRIPSIQQFNGTTFSVPLPIPGYLSATISEFQPDIVHAHHPFLLGDTALRIAALRELPVVFTHHTLYQKYTHYVVGNSDALRRFVTDLAAGYCNLCDAVIAPSPSIRKMLRDHGVASRIEVIPTGVVLDRFCHGDGATFRRQYGIPQDAFVVGHIGRLATEKNIAFLAEAVVECVDEMDDVWFVVAGEGCCAEDIRRIFAERNLSARLVLEGVFPDNRLADAYDAMDVFAFASQSETQGMVITEAMAAGLPVVALDGPGVRETVRDGLNGRLLPDRNIGEFAAAVGSFMQLPVSKMRQFQDAARATAKSLSMDVSAQQALALYSELVQVGAKRANLDLWSAASRRVAQEWKLWENIVDSAGDSILRLEYEDEAMACS